MTVSQIFDQTPEQRRDFMREMGEPTHRGVERTWLMAGYHAAIQKLRTPTHRGEPRDA